MLMTLRDVSKRFGLRTILKNVSLTVPSHSVTLLVGGNGAGKSTLLRIMAGLARPTQGLVNCDCAPEQQGYLGHATFVYPGLTAHENLAFWCRMYQISAPTAERMIVLERVGLARFAHERVTTFSRGMAQRLNLARVLLQKPQLLLLDEPGTGLDAGGTALLHKEVGAARTRGAALVWISHDVVADLPHADRVLALAGQTVAFDGTADAYRIVANIPTPAPSSAVAVANAQALPKEAACS